MGGFEGFTVKPTQVRVGGSVTIRGKPSQELHILLPNGDSKEIKLDRTTGSYNLKEPLGREGKFTISNNSKTNPHTVVVTVIETD